MPGTSAAAAPRAYRSDRRAAQARRTRRAVLEAAAAAFLEHGYAGTTVRAVAAGAGVSVPTVELLFGTKPGLLKAAIDVAIAGDDEPVAVLARDWVDRAARAASPEQLLSVVAGVLGPAQARSAGLVLAAFEASTADHGLAVIAAQLVEQRAGTAGWLVDALAATAPLRPELTRQDAVDTLWIVMDPAVFHRLVHQRGWSLERYQSWIADSVRRLLLADRAAPPGGPDEQHP